MAIDTSVSNLAESGAGLAANAIAGSPSGEERDPYKWRQTEPETYFDSLQRALDGGADRAFLDFDGRSFTYGEIDRRSTKMAHALAKLGVQRGDTVVTLLDTHEDTVVAWFAINKLGGIWVPINTNYKGEFLRHQLADSGTKIVICEAQYIERIKIIAAHLDTIALILSRGAHDHITDCAIPIEALDDHRGDDLTPIDIKAEPGETACLIYTSGTTGASKGCIISHNYLCNGARQQFMSVPPLSNDVLWTSLPMYHLSTPGYVVVASLISQTRATIASRFSVSNFWPDVERSGATLAILLASQFPLLAQAPDNDAMLRCKGQLQIVSGVPITPAVRTIWQERFGVPYLNNFGFGQTEAAKICNRVWGSPMPPLTSSGPVAEDFEVMIVDADRRRVPAGVAGEILVRPQRMNVMFGGYWRRPADTVAVWRDLWMHTGDIGRLDDDGNLFFMDRKKDYVRNRGENISSIEMETALMAHPAISEIAFHGVGSEAGAELDIKVTIVLKEGATPREEEICHWSIDNLPYFAVPRYIEFRTSLPKTPTGRVQKNLLREDGCTPTTWDARAAGIVVRRN